MWQKYLFYKDCTECVQSHRQKQSNLQLVKAQGEVQDLGELLRQRLFPLQVLGRVVVRLVGQSTQQAVQRRFCQRKNTFKNVYSHKKQPREGTQTSGVAELCTFFHSSAKLTTTEAKY